ncbi:MAG: hypothetical protein GEU86_23000 [Actinophytocola sp.]|nr:hypothetical protein [Actinophytocola sp.]
MIMVNTLLARVLAPLAVAALLLAGCGSDDGAAGNGGGAGGNGAEQTTAQPDVPEETTEEAPEAGEPVKIAIKDFDFGEDVTVKAGTEFEVTNEDGEAHTFTTDDGTFDSGSIEPGATETVTIDEPGTYDFHCEPHPNMTGTITVE